jgi:hypothetical protein
MMKPTKDSSEAGEKHVSPRSIIAMAKGSVNGFPPASRKPQIWGLVLWSAGIALSGSAGMTQISALLSFVLGQGEQAVFQRLGEW